MRNYMIKDRIVLVVVGLTVILSSCTDSSSDKPINNVDSIKVDTINKPVVEDTLVVVENPVKLYALSQEDKRILDLLETIDIGFSFMEVKAKYKVLKGIRPEEKNDALAEAGLTESLCKQALFGGEATAEFNFKDDSLYSYFFTFANKDSEKAEQIFQSIKKHYSIKWKDTKLEKVEEENHYGQSYVWPSKNSFVPYLNFNLNTNTIIWGKRFDRTL